MTARVLAALLAMACATASNARAEEPLRGTLTSVGSDTMSVLVTLWAAEFHMQHPDARVQIQAAGSASAPAALLEGAADIGSMSRSMNDAEVTAFRTRYGYAPLRITVAHDAIAIFVNPDDPMTRITLAQIDTIWSQDHRCANAPGDSAIARRWLVNGRDASSGTCELFRETALCGGTYRPGVIAWPGNGAVIAAVATQRNAIGYAGAGYVNALVKPLAVARDDAGEAVAPDAREIASGRYPLTRALYFYVNRKPGRALSALPAAFLEYALSTQGQRLLPRAGFVALGDHELAAQRDALRQSHLRANMTP